MTIEETLVVLFDSLDDEKFEDAHIALDTLRAAIDQLSLELIRAANITHFLSTPVEPDVKVNPEFMTVRESD